jgi:hypothetical protein
MPDDPRQLALRAQRILDRLSVLGADLRDLLDDLVAAQAKAPESSSSGCGSSCGNPFPLPLTPTETSPE